jgi:hypothetical protein
VKAGGQRILIVLVIATLAAAAALQGRLEARRPVDSLEAGELYVSSAKALDRSVLSFDALVADVYWMRAIQHFGGVRRSAAEKKRYELLYPLLDLTTSLDPDFNAPYLFGAIFLAEAQPGGAGRPDLALRLLQKGLKHQPDAWRFAEQIGFVYFLYLNDPAAAADWFGRAARVPGAEPYLASLEATARAEGGDLETSRRIWLRIASSAESDWMRETAKFRLMQIDAAASIEALEKVVADFAAAEGYWPSDWRPFIRARRLRGIPVDPTGVPFVVSPAGTVEVAPASRLYPLPQRVVRRAP